MRGRSTEEISMLDVFGTNKKHFKDSSRHEKGCCWSMERFYMLNRDGKVNKKGASKHSLM